ncbi:MAG: hypothetical protein WC772_01230 [Candidatus Margulisiibacteriota bacterium]|jgi:hypothetical protein
MKNRFLVGSIVVLALAFEVFSIPNLLSFEGRLTDTAGTPVTASTTVQISIYDSLSGGSLIWGPESHTVTPDNQGVFSVLLGETTALAATVFDSSSRYAQIVVGSEILSPRVRIVSVGYAYKAASAQGVEAGSISRSSVATGQFVKQIVAGSGIGVSGDEGSGTGVVTLTATGTGGGTVTSVNSGTGLTGGPITETGTISLAIPVVEINGGTSQSTYTTGDILYSSASNTLSKLPIGSAGQILKVSGGIPSWGAAGGTGTVTEVNTGTGLTGGPITGIGTISVDSSVVTLTGVQTLTNKTFTDTLTTFQNNADNTKKVALDASGVTTAQTRSWTVGSGIPQNIQVFTSGGTWVKPAGVSVVYVEIWGGGGGARNASNNQSGGGGGGGGYCAGLVSVSGNVTVTVGSGGANGNPASAGGASSFAGDITLTANGGSDGSTLGGAGGTATGGTINLTGATGVSGKNSDGAGGGGGGGSPRGGSGGAGGVGANAANPSVNGGEGTQPGGGGGGGSENGGTGGNGGAGLVIVSY